jgi:NADH:ubiquinone oxidoreductase subunit 6 (subunit J)
MTQAPSAGAAQPAPAPAPTTQVVHAAAPAPWQQRRPTTEDVPKLLNRWQVIAVATCLIFGVLAALVQFLAWQAGDRAAANTEQLVRVQDIGSSLYRADALASNAFLEGGLEPPGQRAEYDSTIDLVLSQITDAADAQPADREALGALNRRVTAYTTGVTQARDNNRQALPVGAQYLREASEALRGDAKPVLDELADANSARASDEMDNQHPWWLLFLAVAAVAVLWMVNREIAKRFRRRLNVGLLVAALAFAVLSLVAVIYASSQNGANEDLRAGDFKDAVDEATARTAANDAKALESRRLIDRAAGDDVDEPWAEAAAVVDANTAFTEPWAAYKEAHAEVDELDADGDWDGAVDEATGPSTDAFDAFDEASAGAIAEAGDAAAGELRSNAGGIILTVVTLLVGLLGAVAATWGINQRRREYA